MPPVPKPLLTFIVLCPILGALLLGCGDDGGTQPDPLGEVDLLPGTWTWTLAAVPRDPLVCPGITDSGDTVLCGPVDLETLIAGFGVPCEFSGEESGISISCDGVGEFLGCEVVVGGSGSGMVSPDRDSVQVTLTVDVQVLPRIPTCLPATCTYDLGWTVRRTGPEGCP